MIAPSKSMRKMKGSGSYLKNQVRKNLAKAAFSLFLFWLVLLAAGAIAFYASISYVYYVAALAVSLVPLGVFYFYLRKYRVYKGGLMGEERVSKLLSSKLSDDYLLLNDISLGNGGDIDHIILGPSGVFVLETKNWSGEIICHGDEWMRTGKRGFKSSPSVQVKQNVARVKRVIGSTQIPEVADIRVEGMVVFTNKNAILRLNNPTVPILRLPQLPQNLLLRQSRQVYSRSELEAMGEEILRQRR